MTNQDVVMGGTDDADKKQQQEEVSLPQYDKAIEIAAADPKSAVQWFNEVLKVDDPEEKYVKLKESSIYKLGEIYAKLGLANELRQLLVDIRPFFSLIPKARTAKIVRSLIDLIGNIPNSLQLQIDLCKESIRWCKAEKRTFLKQRVESRLADLLLQSKDFKGSLALTTSLVREVKKLDDKLLLCEIFLAESKVHLALQNIPKSKASLTAARANSNAIYCPPLLQAQIDEQAGTLCTEEKDYKTGFSYFYESFESYHTLGNASNAVRNLKYMLLCKVMTGTPGDVFSIISGKAGLKYSGAEVDAMRAVAEAYKKRSLHSLESALVQYKKQLQEDPIIKSQLGTLYENLLEQNLIRIIEPYSRVEIAKIAQLIDLPVPRIEAKLSEMILDGFHAILDQGSGNLIVFDQILQDETYGAAISTLKELSTVVDRLYVKAKRLAV